MMNRQPYREFQQTVLVSSNSNPQQRNIISSDHPLFYVKQKNYFLQQLANKVSINQRFNPLDLKRNARIDHLIAKHEQINKNIQKQQKKRQMFLSSNDYKPILGINDEEKRIKKQQQEAERLRQQLYQSYVQQCHIHQAPQKDQQYEQFKLVKQQQSMRNFTVLSDYRSDPIRKKQLYLLDLEISKLKQEQKLEKQVKNKLSSCSNNKLLSKISNTIISSYMVYFDEIFDAMMDEILEEEVVYLNSLEAGFYEGQSKRKDPQSEVKAAKMMQLVKALDDLVFD